MSADTRADRSINMDGATLVDVTLNSPRIAEITTPTAPSDGGGGELYTKSDGKLYFISNEVAETDVTDAGPVTALNNATANELITIGATTTELDAEANLTFDGSTLTVTGDLSSNGAAVFNEAGADKDFRIETGGNTHALFVDGGNNGVAIGASSALPGLTVVNDYQTAVFEGILDDGDYSGEVLKYSPGANDTLTAGQIYFLHTDGTWNSTDADAVASGASQLLGVGLGGSSQTVGVLTRGFIRIPSTEILNLPGAGECDGLPLYISTTAGHFDFTAPSGNADFVRIVGYAIDDASSDVLVYFNPDHTWVKVTA